MCPGEMCCVAAGFFMASREIPPLRKTFWQYEQFVLLSHVPDEEDNSDVKESFANCLCDTEWEVEGGFSHF